MAEVIIEESEARALEALGLVEIKNVGDVGVGGFKLVIEIVSLASTIESLENRVISLEAKSDRL